MKTINTFILLIIFLSSYSQTVIYSEDFDSGDPLWTTTGSWEHGIATSGGEDPGTDHTSGNTNNFVYGQNLGGNYSNNVDEYLQTPAFDCSTSNGVSLTYWRHTYVENDWDKSYVEISTDGSTWTDLGEPLFPQDVAWTEVTIDISAYADNQATVYIRWGLNSDGFVTYGGWNIDDFSLSAQCSSTPNAPVISAYPAVIQEGENVLLNGSYDTGTLHWYINACRADEIGTGNQLTETPINTLFYYAAVEDANGCFSDCDRVQVIVAQACDVSAYADGQTDTINICSGESVDISAIGGCGFLMDDSFDDGTLSVGWSSNADPMFNNPCGAGPDGSTYLWIGSASSFPRELVTQQYSVTTDCQICFDMRYAEQTSISGTDCEGPDLSNEGVHIQWSIDDGATWTDIDYYDPNGGHDAQYINWNHYCLDVPAGAVGDYTRFRFFQDLTSGNDYDHWGLDNVEITCPTPNQTIQWSYGPTELDPTADVLPTTTTTYTIIVNDGYNVDNADTATVVVNVMGTPNTSDEAACTSGDDVTFVATGGTDYAWYDASTGGTLLGTGSSYVLSNLTSTTKVYVEELANFNTINYSFDSDMEGWIAETPCSHTSYNWSWKSNSGNGVLKAKDPSAYSEQLVHSPIIDVSSLSTVDFSYNHKYKTEDNYDAGIVVYRLDGGNWQYFTPSIIGYDDVSTLYYKISDNTCSSENMKTYNGNGNTYVTDGGDIDVSSASQLEVGFILTSDGSVEKKGWYINTVTIDGSGAGVCPNLRAEATAYLSDLHAGSNVTPPSCYGNADGKIQGEALDGLGMPIGGIFSYNWSTGDDVATISDITAGNYDLTIIDQYNCEATTSISLPEATTPTGISNVSGTSGNCNIDSPDEWVYIVDATDETKVIAAVFDATGDNSLFSTEAEADISSSVQNYNGEYYLQRVTRVTPVSQGPADVRIYFTQAELDALMAADPEITGISDLAVTKCDENGSWQNCMLLSSTFSSSNIGSGYYAEVSVTSFSKFYIHKDTKYILPVQLVSFDAKCDNKNVTLNWTTSVEINNDYFLIYRSYDGINFDAIDYVEGNGNSNKIINYSYVDKGVNGENVFYKLEQFDYNGVSKESKIVASTCDQSKISITKYSEQISINFTGKENNEYTLLIVNSIGQTVLSNRINISDDFYLEQIITSSFEKGIYYLSVISTDEIITEKIFIK